LPFDIPVIFAKIKMKPRQLHSSTAGALLSAATQPLAPENVRHLTAEKPID
jgi:hypothetical protein